MKNFLMSLCLGATICLVLIEWAVGCGEVTYLPDHTWESNDCVFLPREVSYGEW
jgi:hypothetical protein